MIGMMIKINVGIVGKNQTISNYLEKLMDMIKVPKVAEDSKVTTGIEKIDDILPPQCKYDKEDVKDVEKRIDNIKV